MSRPREHTIDEHYEGPRPAVSIVVLTLDEEVNIEDCLASCSWSDDVHVLDSGSHDRTVELAERAGARTHVNLFRSFGQQRNWAIDHIQTRHDWVFHLDADERFTTEIVREIADVLASSPSEAGFHVPSKLMFMGRWLKRCGGYPTYQVRLFHKNRMRFTDHGHGQREKTTGRIGWLKQPYLHHNFSKGVDEWFDKHNRYSRLEAEQALADADRPITHLIQNAIASSSVERRRALKVLSYHVPFRAALVPVYMLLVQRGLLDGRAGRTYAKMRAHYEGLIDLKLSILRQERKGITDKSMSRPHGVEPHQRSAEEAKRRAARADLSPSERVVHDPFARAQVSPWTTREKILRALWMLTRGPLFRASWHNWYGWRRVVLRLFGAKLASTVRIRPTAHVEIPWLLEVGDFTTIGDHAKIYNLGRITIGKYVLISQNAHLCAGSHDFTRPDMPLLRPTIDVEDHAWVAADAYIGPHVTIGEGAILGARGAAFKSLAPWTIFGGNPSKKLADRPRFAIDENGAYMLPEPGSQPKGPVERDDRPEAERIAQAIELARQRALGLASETDEDEAPGAEDAGAKTGTDA